MQTGELRGGRGGGQYETHKTYVSFPYIDSGCLQILSKSNQREQFWIGKSEGSSNDELKCSSN